MSDTANVIATYVAELEALRVALRLQTEAAEHSERECQRLSGLLKEEQEATKHQFALLQSLRVELREARYQLDKDDQLRTRLEEAQAQAKELGKVVDMLQHPEGRSS